MAITFQKRQKEMKRMEKQRAKAERRAQKKLEKRDTPEGSGPPIEHADAFPEDPEIAPPLDHSAR